MSDEQIKIHPLKNYLVQISKIALAQCGLSSEYMKLIWANDAPMLYGYGEAENYPALELKMKPTSVQIDSGDGMCLRTSYFICLRYLNNKLPDNYTQATVQNAKSLNDIIEFSNLSIAESYIQLLSNIWAIASDLKGFLQYQNGFKPPRSQQMAWQKYCIRKGVNTSIVSCYVGLGEQEALGAEIIFELSMITPVTENKICCPVNDELLMCLFEDKSK